MAFYTLLCPFLFFHSKYQIWKRFGMANMDKSGDRLKAGAQLLNSKLLALANWQRQLTVFTIKKKSLCSAGTFWGCPACPISACLGLFWLISSHIILFILPAEHYLLDQPNSEHYLVCSRLELFQPEAVVQQLCC